MSKFSIPSTNHGWPFFNCAQGIFPLIQRPNLRESIIG
jgi:hypothetical protein